MRILFTITLSLYFLVNHAQPVINSSDVTPIFGESFEIFDTDYIDPGDAGANVTWDLSLASGTAVTLDVVDPSTTPFASSFPEATYCNVVDGQYDYYESTATSISRVGAVSGGLVIFPYENNQLQYQFPMAYTDTWTDSFRTTFNNGGVDFDRDGILEAEVDGWGKLILPYGTVVDVLRIKIEEVYRDEFSVGPVTSSIDYTTEIYIWMKAGTHNPVAAMSLLNSTAGNFQTGIYIGESSVTVGLESPLANIEVFPNPATAQIQIQLPESALSNWSLVNMQGITVAAGQGSGTQLIDVKDYARGMYLLVLQQGGQSSTTKMLLK